MILLNVPIEPLEERYSVQWDRWFKDAFAQEEAFTTINIYGGSTSGKINSGSFLDVVETNVYKLVQLMKILDFLKNVKKDEKVVIFFHDLWFPGLESIAYVRDGLGLKNLKICGCLHAGSYDEYDFLARKGMEVWARNIELGWFNGIIDKIFVATKFHRNLLIETRLWKNSHKIVVTGFPFFSNVKGEKVEKENIIVFPHRLDPEKNPQMFDEIQERIEPFLPDWKFVKSKEVTKNKEEYYQLLAKSKIALSFADQETWGIAMQEALDFGCAVICPDRLSYPEMYSEKFIFYNTEDLQNQIISIVYQWDDYQSLIVSNREQILYAGNRAIPNMIKEIMEL